MSKSGAPLNVANIAPPAIRPLYALASGLGLWVGLVLLFATQFVLVGSFSWHEAVVQALFFWSFWALYMPVVVLLSFWFPFMPGRIRVNLTIHLLACILVVVISQEAIRHVIPAPPPSASEESGNPDETRPTGNHPPPGLLSLRAGLDILVYWALFGVCQGVTNFRRSQQRERRAAELEARLAHAKLQALRMQINPHFLFNTLNAIATLVYINPKAADEMIGDLSELLRRCLEGVEEQEVALGRELQFISAYVGIEQRRFGERLRMEQEVPAELLSALVPALILQPLVENAIRHGIEPQRAPGVVQIRVRREGNTLQVTVQDNGRGPAGNGARPAHRGVGLPNTRARLQELYGKNQRFSFGPGKESGCRVELHLPYHTKPILMPAVNAAPPT